MRGMRSPSQSFNEHESNMAWIQILNSSSNQCKGKCVNPCGYQILRVQQNNKRIITQKVKLQSEYAFVKEYAVVLINFSFLKREICRYLPVIP